MKNSLNRFFAGIACAALIVGLNLPAQAAETAIPIRVSSYKGNTLQVGDRSGLIIGGTVQTVTSASPEIVTVENVGGYWVAVAKSDGTAVLTATGRAGETASLTLTVGEPTPSSSHTTAEVPVPVTELDKVRQEIIRLVNEVRRENGVSELTVSDALMDAAQEQAETLYTYHRMKEECEAALAHGYPYGFGSNITAFTGTATADAAQKAVNNWVESPGHFQTMIDPDCDTIGVGFAEDQYKTVCYLFVGNPQSHNPYE